MIGRDFKSANRRPQSARRLWLCGLAMTVVLATFAWRYPLGPNSNRLIDIGKLSSYGAAGFAHYSLGMLMLFGMYLLALRESRRLPARQVLPVVFGCAALMALAIGGMYPVTAIDVFLYAVRSRLLSSYGVDPISVPFAHYPADQWNMFSSADWSARVSPYGPLWNLLAAPITWLAGDRMYLALLGFKLLAVLSLLGGGWVIVRVCQTLGRTDAARSALLYMWNPLVLWEGVGNAHNDLLVTLVLLLALLAWQRRRDPLVIPLLLVAALIKYITLPLLPLAAIALWRRAESRPARWWVFGGSLALSVAALGLALFPFYDFRAIPASILEQNTLFYTSPAAMAVALLHQRYPTELIELWATRIGQALLVLALAWQAWRLWRAPERLPRACFDVLYVFLLVAVASSRAWYLIWPIGLAALLPGDWPAWRMIAWSAGAIASYAVLIWLEAWWQLGSYRVQVVVLPVILAGTLLLTLAEQWRGRATIGNTEARIGMEPPAGRSAH